MRSVVVSAVFMLIITLVVAEKSHADETARRSTTPGREMTTEEKTALEEQVTRNPYDVKSRTRLLDYYSINQYSTNGQKDAEAASARLRHIVWLIEHAPESEVLGSPYSSLNKRLEPTDYEQVSQAWLKALQDSPENPLILMNASRFFLHDDRNRSEELLLRGQALNPDSPRWPASLGHLYSLGLRRLPTDSARKATAEKAFRQYQLAYELSNASGRDLFLTNLAKTAFAAGRIDDARKFAQEMLDNDTPGWNHGNRIHHGNLILGRIALVDGNIDEAKSRLLLAGQTNGSPLLNSFGPNMLLAKELLERGETEVVLEYFELCKVFRSSPRQKLDQWIDDVKSNRIPQFGGNLAY